MRFLQREIVFSTHRLPEPVPMAHPRGRQAMWSQTTRHHCCTAVRSVPVRRRDGVEVYHILATIIIGSSLEEFFFFLSSKARIDFEYIIGAPRRKKNNGLGIVRTQNTWKYTYGRTRMTNNYDDFGSRWVNPFGAPEPLPLLYPSSFVPKTGFQL